MKSFLTKNFKKILCLVMVAALVVGTINLGGLRVKAEGTPSDGSVSIVNGYAPVNTIDGVEVVDVDQLVDNAVVTSASDDIAISKTISANTMSGEEYGYDITLQVQTSQTVTSKDIAVLLLFDVSNSMMDDNNHTPLTSAKAAANGFIDQLAQSAAQNSNNVKVSVVKFGSMAKKVTDWINVANGTGLNAVKNAISSIVIDENDVGGGTNMQAGLKLAANRLGMIDIANINYKYVVMFSDGGPTFRYTGSSDSFEGITGNYTKDGDGTQITKQKCDGAIAGANAVKAAGGNLYSVFLESTDYTIEEQCYTYKVDTSEYKYKKVTRDEYLSATADKFSVDNACNSNPKYVDSKSQVTTRNWKSITSHSGYCKNCYKDWGNHSTLYYVWSPVQGDKPYTIEDLLTDMSSKYECDSESGTIERAALFTASSTDDLTAAFTGVMNSISVGSTGAGWTVTDPMSEYVTFASEDTGYNRTTRTLSWVLDPANANTSEKDTNGKTVYTYTKTYHVTFNMDAYAANKNDNDKVATNGVTKLTYDGQVMNFNIPVLSAKAPEYYYTVKYWQKNKESGDYEVIGTDSTNYARLYSAVSISDIDENYATKYDGYSFNSEKSNTNITISATSKNNVINLYYDPIPATIEVERIFVSIGDDEIRTIDATVADSESKSGYSGDSFTYGDPELSYSNGNYSYVYKKTITGKDKDGKDVNLKSVTEIESLIPDGESDGVKVVNNKIVLCYERDARENATVSLIKYYTIHTFTLNNGRYVATEERESDKTELVSVPVTTNYTLGEKTSYEEDGWTIKRVLFNGTEVEFASTNKVVKRGDDNDNLIEIFYEKNTKWPESKEVVVNHHYEYTNWYIDANGDLQSEKKEDHKYGTSITEYLEGETFVPKEDKFDKNRKEYTPKADNIKWITVDRDNNKNKINLYYTADDVFPNEAGVTVNHIYRTKTVETIVTTGAGLDGNEIITGYTTIDLWSDDNSYTKKYPENNKILYVDQKVTVGLEAKEGYTFTQSLSDNYDDVRANNQELNLVYVHDATADNRDYAEVIVEITYLKSGQEIVNGEIKDFTDREDGSDKKEYKNLRAGDTFAIDSDDYAGFAKIGEVIYTGDSANTDSIEALQSGTNVIKLVFRRDVGVSELKKIDVKAENVYRTWNMTVQNGKADYYEEGIKVDERVDAEYAPEEGYYVGQKIIVKNGEKDEYVKNNNNPPLEQVLSNDNREFIYNYDQKIELPKSTVTVTNHYTTIDVNTVGERTSNTVDVSTYENEMYVGEDYFGTYSLSDGFTAENFKSVKVDGEDAAKSATVKVVVTSGNAIDFYFEKVNDESKPIEFVIVHEYETYDWDGSEIIAQHSISTVTGTSFETVMYNVKPETMEGLYTLTDATATSGIALAYEGSLADTSLISFEFISGENKVELLYKRVVDTRVGATVVINHHYSSTDTYTNKVSDEGTDSKTYTGTADNKWLDGKVYVGAKFEFADNLKQTNFGGKTYSFDSVSPAAIELSNDGSNVIDVYYSRTFSSYVPDDTPYVPVIIPDDGGDDETEETIIVPDVPQGDIEVEPTPEVTPEITPEPTVDIEVPEVPEALPKTGTTPIALFFGLGGLCLTCGAVLVVFGRRKEN